MAEHIVPRRIYFTVYAALMACTFLTWRVAYIDLGAFNAVAAIAIAVVKMLLVILFFMHVRYSTRLTWLAVAGSFFWLAIMLSVTLTDYLTRGWKTYG